MSLMPLSHLAVLTPDHSRPLWSGMVVSRTGKDGERSGRTGAGREWSSILVEVLPTIPDRFELLKKTGSGREGLAVGGKSGASRDMVGKVVSWSLGGRERTGMVGNEINC